MLTARGGWLEIDRGAFNHNNPAMSARLTQVANQHSSLPFSRTARRGSPPAQQTICTFRSLLLFVKARPALTHPLQSQMRGCKQRCNAAAARAPNTLVTPRPEVLQHSLVRTSDTAVPVTLGQMAGRGLELDAVQIQLIR